LRAAGLAEVLKLDPVIDAAAAGVDAAAFAPLPPAAPCPPLAARPRRLSVTQIETWLGDPYAIYARHILQLKALDELDADPGRADLGICVHAALAEFVRRFPRDLPADARAEMLSIGGRHFAGVLSRPGAWAFWWPRFERIADWLITEEAPQRATTIESFAELEGSLILRDFSGGSFELIAKADRIDRLRSGAFLLIDYKTGALPKKAAIRDGFAPQLPLEAAILRDGAFGEVTGTPAALEYWKLGGRAPAGQRCPIDDGKPDLLVDRALDKLRALVKRFDDPATPYLAAPAPERRPRFSDYEHLERIGHNEAEEW
jgi:ATP-dependent helicase/nuclease subunit B